MTAEKQNEQKNPALPEGQPPASQAEAPVVEASQAVWNEFLETHTVPSGYQFDGIALTKIEK